MKRSVHNKLYAVVPNVCDESRSNASKLQYEQQQQQQIVRRNNNKINRKK